MDATREDGSLGRLVNDDHKTPNCRMKIVESETEGVHLCLFVIVDEIKQGTEITYNYGSGNYPWRVSNF